MNEAISITRDIEAGHATAAIHVGGTAFLGVDIQQRDYFLGSAVVSGLVITDVVAGSPAAETGLAAGDVITTFAGEAVSSSTTLTDLILGRSPGTTVQLGWLDQFGNPNSASVTLASGPAQ